MSKSISDNSDLKQLRAELVELKARLEESEQTLNAIRNGEVDAVLVSGVDGERIFTIQGAETPYRILIEDMQEGALSLTPEGIILYANLRFSEMVGMPLESVLGSSLFEHIKTHTAQVSSLIERAAYVPTKQEVEFETSDGKVIPVLLSASPIVGDDSQRVGMVVTDLTTQKIHEEMVASERILRESEKRFREIADAMPQMVWAARPDGWLYYFNKRWYEFTGFKEGQEGDQSWQPILHPEDLPRCMDSWYQAVQSGTPYEIEYRFIDRNTGEYLWHLGRALPMRDEAGNIVRWYGTSTNIDAQKKAEAERDSLITTERLARNAAESANRMKDNFLATLSHELRTPLNVILGYAQLLRKKRKDSREFLDQALLIIEKNARVQANLITDLLDMSRIISGKFNLEIESVNLRGLVEEVFASMRPAAEAKSVQFKVKIEDRVPQVSGDATRLRQVIWNLLSNAIKFSTKGGMVELTLRALNDRVQIVVSDTGLGISPQFLPHVFDTFRQADTTSSRKFGGLGLGLSIVRHLVELHGGEVAASSAGENQGAQFIVSLPLSAQLSDSGDNLSRDVEKQAAIAPECTTVDLHGLKVLVVDDERDARSLLDDLLTDLGAEVVTAGSAKEAYATLQTDSFDVLISDLGMPSEDGYELIEKVRALPGARGGQTPAIALTAFARTEDRQHALLAGFQSHMAKPVRADELTAEVANLAGRFLKA